MNKLLEKNQVADKNRKNATELRKHANPIQFLLCIRLKTDWETKKWRCEWEVICNVQQLKQYAVSL